MRQNKFTYKDYLEYKDFLSSKNYLQKYLDNWQKNQEKKDSLNEETSEYNLEEHKKTNYPHDKIYKMILTNKEEVVSLINQVLNIEEEKYKITQDKIEIYKNNFITTYMENRSSDIIYKLKNKKIFFLIEHQSTIDYSMPFRLVEYCVLIMQSVIDKKQMKRKNYKFPQVYPIVLYTGNREWNQQKYLEQNQENLVGYKSKTFTSYNIIDVNKYTKKELLEAKGMLSKIMLLEKIKTEKELIETVKEITNKNLIQEEKILIKNVLYNILSRSISKEIIHESIELLESNKGDETKMIIEEVLRKSQEKEYKRGIKDGINQGISQGISQGINQGISQGIEQGIKKIVKEMIKNNIEDEVILKLTHIAQEELEKIKKDL